MRIAVDSDDAGIELKRMVVEYLRESGATVEDLDLLASQKVDYPDIGYNLARRVANKVEGVYAGVCHDVYSAERLRKSNDAQVITMGARVVGPELAKSVLAAWLKSEFEAGRSLPKVQRMRELEGIELKRPGNS
jgi:ribose 5-phosphate isomerase B